MQDMSKYKVLDPSPFGVLYTLESEPDLLIVVPVPGRKDTAETASEGARLLYGYAASIGRPCGVVIIMESLLSQDPEARRVYQHIDKSKVYAAALVVESALARALGSFFIGLTRPLAPTRLFNSIDGGLAWLKTVRPSLEEE